MDCDHLLELIHHYMDGGLPQWRMRAITRHLDDCPPCAEGYRVELHFRSVVATKCREELPYNLQRRIEEALGCLPPADGVARGSIGVNERSVTDRAFNDRRR